MKYYKFNSTWINYNSFARYTRFVKGILVINNKIKITFNLVLLYLFIIYVLHTHT